MERSREGGPDMVKEGVQFTRYWSGDCDCNCECNLISQMKWDGLQ